MSSHEPSNGLSSDCLETNMASIIEEDLKDVKILIIPEVSEYKEGSTRTIVTHLKSEDDYDNDFEQKIVDFFQESTTDQKSTKTPGRKRKGVRNRDVGEKKMFLVGDLLEIEEDNRMPKGKHQCKLCYKAFNHKSTLSRHKHLTHTANPPVFTCAHCHKTYKTKVSLRRHLQSVESSNSNRKSGLKVNCAICDYTCGKSEMLDHYETVHNTIIEKEIIKFPCEEDFQIWKNQTECETTARFTKIRKDRIIKDGTKESFYRCHRDGVYKPRGKNLRNLKKIGSNKINGHCPAKMQVWIKQDEEVSVMFVKTHVGHDMELSRLTLTKQERDHIAQQLALQVPFDTILEACRESAVGAENIRRMNLLTRKDLYNIESSYRLSKLTYRNCLGVNIENWVKAMIGTHCDTFIKFYKPQGKILEDYPHLDSEDFLLVLMNDVQVDILKKGGRDNVCIDSTLIASEFSLLTVLVLDEQNQGFPVAFLITNNCDAYVMEMFFFTLKEATSMIFRPYIFISGLDETTFKAWTSVMQSPSFRIFSPWIVDEEWRSNLEKITNPEKQVEYYNKLLSIMMETNVQTFEDELDCTFRAMSLDPETREFADFFEVYKSKASAWAHCFRRHLGLNVNDQLERLQSALKIVYESKVKKVMHLEKFIFTLMSSLKENLFHPLITLNAEFMESMKNDHQRFHALAEETSKNSVSKKPKQWNVSVAGSDVIYKVRILFPECSCEHSCPYCNACMHAYICSCVNSSLKWVVCEHIHMVCIKIKNSSSFAFKSTNDDEEKTEIQTYTVDDINADNPNQTNLIINVPESTYQYMTVPAEGEDGNVLLTFETDEIDDNAELILGYAEEDPDVNVEERRSLLAQKCQNILNRISSEAQVAAFEQAMASLETEVTFID